MPNTDTTIRQPYYAVISDATAFSCTTSTYTWSTDCVPDRATALAQAREARRRAYRETKAQETKP